MIIWRGWGIAALPVVLLLVFGLGTLISTALGSEEIDGVGAGIGLLLAAPTTYFLGTWLNRRTAHKAAEEYAVARRAQLYQQIEQTAETQTWRDLQGLSQDELRVRWADAHARNWTHLEAGAMTQLEVERAEVLRRSGSHHTLFFIPVQWLWVPLVIGGVLAIVGSLSSR